MKIMSCSFVIFNVTFSLRKFCLKIGALDKKNHKMCMYFQCSKLSHASLVTRLKGNNFSLVEKLLLSDHTIGRPSPSGF